MRGVHFLARTPPLRPRGNAWDGGTAQPSRKALDATKQGAFRGDGYRTAGGRRPLPCSSLYCSPLPHAGVLPPPSKVRARVSLGKRLRRGEPTEQWETVQSVNPEDILSEDERTGLPELKDWNDPGGSEPVQLSTDTSAGPIPAVKPFNFGRDPGGPKDKTLYLTVAKLGFEDAPVFDSMEDEELDESTIHVPATGASPGRRRRTPTSTNIAPDTRRLVPIRSSTDSQSLRMATRSTSRTPTATSTSTR